MLQAEISEDERRARKYVSDVRAFYLQAILYGVVNAILAVVNLITSPGYLWFLWAAFGWGIAIAIHGLSLFGIVNLFGDDWEERQVSKRLERTRRRRDGGS